MSATTYNSNAKFNRNILFGGYNAEYNLSVNLKQENKLILALSGRLINELLPADILKSRELVDIKGRDVQNSLSNPSIASYRPLGDEILFIAGSLNKSHEESSDENSQSEPAEFFVSINSEFDKFIGSKQISHTFRTTGSEDQITDIKHIADYNVSINLLRIGIDLFSSHYFSFIGFAPEVTQSLLLELTPEKLELRISAEKLKTKQELPLQAFQLFSKLDKILSDTFQIDLLDDYKDKLN